MCALARLLGSVLGSLFLVNLSDKLLVLGKSSIRLFDSLDLESFSPLLSLDGKGSDKPLDLGGLGVGLLALLHDLTADDVLAHIVALAEIEQFADVACSLGTQAAGLHTVSKTTNFTLTLLDDDEVKDGKIVADDATSDTLSSPGALTAYSKAAGSLIEEKTDTLSAKDTLLHGETLLVVSSTDAENVALELITEHFSLNLLRDALVIEVP